MKFTLKVPLGNSTLTIEQECDGIKGLFKEAGIFSTFPSECNNCKSGNLALNERQTAKGEYYEITCQDCNYRKEYGQSKDKTSLFPKDWEAPYEKDGETSTASSKTAGKKTGKSALEKARDSKKAAAKEEVYENVEESPKEEEAQEETKTAASDKRSALLAKFGKKKGA